MVFSRKLLGPLFLFSCYLCQTNLLAAAACLRPHRGIVGRVRCEPEMRFLGSDPPKPGTPPSYLGQQAATPHSAQLVLHTAEAGLPCFSFCICHGGDKAFWM